jgi:hypothetical protein
MMTPPGEILVTGPRGYDEAMGRSPRLLLSLVLLAVLSPVTQAHFNIDKGWPQ